MKFEKNLVGKIKKHRTSWKKRTRGNCEAEASQQKKKTKIPRTLLEVFGT